MLPTFGADADTIKFLALREIEGAWLSVSARVIAVALGKYAKLAPEFIVKL